MNKRRIPVQIRLSIKSDHLVLGCLFRLTLLISETIARPNTDRKFQMQSKEKTIKIRLNINISACSERYHTCTLYFCLVMLHLDIFVMSYLYNVGGHCGRDRMVVGFTTTCVISAYHH